VERRLVAGSLIGSQIDRLVGSLIVRLVDRSAVSLQTKRCRNAGSLTGRQARRQNVGGTAGSLIDSQSRWQNGRLVGRFAGSLAVLLIGSLTVSSAGSLTAPQARWQIRRLVDYIGRKQKGIRRHA
jgi:hypothetical protein